MNERFTRVLTWAGPSSSMGSSTKAGRSSSRRRTPSPDSIDDLLGLLGRIWQDLKKGHPGRIKAAGFGFAGFYSLRERKILHSPNYPSLNGFDLVPAFQEISGRPLPDRQRRQYGRFRRIQARGRASAQSLVLLTVGTGIGSGIILDGKLWQGQCGFAGELGHITVNPEGSKCNCGNIGCLETEASAPKIVRNYAALSREGRRADLGGCLHPGKTGRSGRPGELRPLRLLPWDRPGHRHQLPESGKDHPGGRGHDDGRIPSVSGRGRSPETVPPGVFCLLFHRQGRPGQRRGPHRSSFLGRGPSLPREFLTLPPRPEDRNHSGQAAV